MNRYDELIWSIAFCLPDDSGNRVMQFWHGEGPNPQHPAIGTHLEQLEAAIQSRLPDDYREFIPKYGGVLVPIGVVLPQPTAEGMDIGMLSGFHPLSSSLDGNEVDGDSLISIYQGKPKSSSDEFLEIAFGDNGYWYLGVRGEHRGKVFFHDSQAGGDFDQLENVHLIANSFDEFLNKLAG